MIVVNMKEKVIITGDCDMFKKEETLNVLPDAVVAGVPAKIVE